jgi:hypothetical protein
MTTIGNDQGGIPCLLEFLKILPEEVTEGRKFNLSVCSSPARPSDIGFGSQLAALPISIQV